MSKATERAAKEGRAKIRAAFDKDSTHLRVGSWNGLEGCSVTVLGTLRELHGTACTCCPRRPATQAGAA
jgi:hypothetical protein